MVVKFGSLKTQGPRTAFVPIGFMLTFSILEMKTNLKSTRMSHYPSEQWHRPTAAASGSLNLTLENKTGKLNGVAVETGSTLLSPPSSSVRFPGLLRTMSLPSQPISTRTCFLLTLWAAVSLPPAFPSCCDHCGHHCVSSSSPNASASPAEDPGGS